MKIVLIITFVETLALSLWMLRRWLGGQLLTDRVLATVPITAINRTSSPRAPRAFINFRQVEAQSDDRKQAVGSVLDGPVTPSAHRAFARRSHQTHYKQWSQERHE